MHIAGETKSTDFPVTAGAARPTFGGGTFDAVYARLSADGSLGYGTYIGGTDTDQAFGVAVDAAGAAYVLGGTNSSVAEQFPVTGNAYRATLNGLRDVFVARILERGRADVLLVLRRRQHRGVPLGRHRGGRRQPRRLRQRHQQ